MIDGIQHRHDPMAIDFLPDAIKAGHFLGHPTTLKLFKEEGLLPGKAVDRASAKVGGGGPTDYERAQKVVEDLLAKPRFVLDDKLRRELDRVVLADARQYGLEAIPALPA
jgi:trimethylamine:corrinoid methyltransferase-like protein